MTPFTESESQPWRARFLRNQPSHELDYEVAQPPRSYLGGFIATFELRTLHTKVAVFCPKAAVGAREVDVLVYAHGLLDRCEDSGPPSKPPEGLITGNTFRLGKLVDASGRKLILVVPFFNWQKPLRPGLENPAKLNALVDEVLSEIGNLEATPPPSLTNLMLAGHSRAYDFLEPLARAQAQGDPETQRRALARISEVWMFDSTYRARVDDWMAWIAAKPDLKVSVFYRQNSPTAGYGLAFLKRVKQGGGRLRVAALDPRESLPGISPHCAVPARQLPGLLGGSAVVPIPPPATVPVARPRAIPSLGSLRRRIIETAEHEWMNWKQGTIRETDPAATPLLTDYYRMGVGRKVTAAELQSKAWQSHHPWSAVFVSYVMRTAGAGRAFGYSAAHAAYVAAAKRAGRDATKFRAFHIDEAPLEPGDVVCADRLDPATKHCSGTRFETVESGGNSHGEIVLEVNLDQGYAITIGGNTSQQYPQIRGAAGGDTVGKHKVDIDSRGFVVNHPQKCPYFAVLKAPDSAPEREDELEEETDPGERAFVASQMAHEHDPRALTDAVFYRRHPELGRRPLSKDETDLRKEWLSILHTLVDPLLPPTHSGQTRAPRTRGVHRTEAERAQSIAARPVPGMPGVTIGQLVESWRVKIAPEIPLSVLLAFIHIESGGNFRDATHGSP